MADDMRTKSYPPLPPKGAGPRIAIVLPTTGDLRLRSLLPDVFQQQLAIHADVAYYPFYARFVVLRKFIVMSSDGDLYTQTVRTTLELKDLPHQQLLPLPSISPWAIIKVLDLVQCFSGNVGWELVCVRWQSGMVSWLPIELLQHHFANLLQAFYVNSINSWGFRDRIYAQSLQSFQTEVELWLHHDEFRKFYQYLRQRRAMVASGATATSYAAPQPAGGSSQKLRDKDVKSALKRSLPQQSVRPAPAPPVRPPVQPPLPPQQQRYQPPLPPQQQKYQLQQQRGAAATNHDRSQPQQRHPPPPFAPVVTHQSRHPTTVSSSPKHISSAAQTREEWGHVPSNTPVAVRDRERSVATSPSETARRPAPLPPPRQNPPPVADKDTRTTVLSPPNAASESRATALSAPSAAMSKRFKRLKKQHTIDDTSESEDTDVALDVSPASSAAPSAEAKAVASASGNTGISTVAIIDDDDDDTADDSDSRNTPLVIGDIRCVCGAVSVGAYTGKWLHCWHDDCGVWEHADCVGLLGRDAVGNRYECSSCDATACRTRRTAAASRLVEWLFQCCESNNTVQLLKLLREHPSQERWRGWANAAEQNMTLLMKAARCGLTKGVQYLVHVAKVDVFATDAASLNVLHHAALGGKRRCVLYLLNQEPKLLEHQDKTGRTPFHCLLASAALNDICLKLLKNDASLATKGDLTTNAPIHYACRALTSATPEICRILLQSQPQSLTERSSDGLSPFLLLCGVDTSALSTTTATAYVKEVMRMMLDIDVLGSFLDARALNGWTSIHFAAASGNHELLSFLCQHEFVDAHATTSDGVETALHIAAKNGHALCVRVLLRLGLRETAKDAQGWIPMIYADRAACVMEFLPYKLTKQLSRLNRMTGKFQQQDIVRRWQRRVVVDPACFDMINDWCQCDLERIKRMSGLFLASPFMLRLDNKLDYLYKMAFPALRAPSQQQQRSESIPVDAPSPRRGTKFVFAAANGSFWKQFVQMAKHLEPDDFRAPMQFAVDSSVDAAACRDSKAVLVQLAAAFAATEPGVVSHGVVASADMRARTKPLVPALREQLLDFYLLGELVAHLVLFEVSLSGILDLSTPFLRCALREAEPNDDAQWLLPARSFAGGFDHVLPPALAILRVADFRVLVNGRKHMLDANAVDWERAMEWAPLGESANAKAWWSRLVAELVVEEQQLLLLVLTETFAMARQKLWVAGSGEVRVLQRLVKVVRFFEPESDESAFPDDDANSQVDALMPFVDLHARAISLPAYSHYDAFKSALLRWIRCLDAAFRQR